MSSNDPYGDFGGDMGRFIPSMFADVMKMMQVQDPTQFDLISQLAMSIVADPEEKNVDPKDRIVADELARIAELHVADVTGMPTTPSGQPVTVHTLTRTAWVQRSLIRWKGLLGEMVRARNQAGRGASDDETNVDHEDMSAMMEKWFTMLGPTLAAMQIGSAIGHLGKRSRGQYDLLLPGDFADGPAIIINNRKAFANDWSLPEDDVMLWLTVNDLTVHSVLSRPHVSQRLRGLILAHAATLSIDAQGLQHQLESTMPSNMSELAEILSGSNAIEAKQVSENQHQTQRELETLVTVIRGYADWVSQTVAERAIGARTLIEEAIKRSRIERSDDEVAGDAIVGVEQSPEMYDLGRRFIQGVIERDGDRSLSQIWVVESNLPTPAELKAPGLWLERIRIEHLL